MHKLKAWIQSNLDKLSYLIIALNFLLLLYYFLSGNVWFINLISFIPSTLFILIGFSLLIFGIIKKVKIINFILISLNLLISIFFVDLNPYFFTNFRTSADESQSISIFSWNMQFWQDKESIPEFINFIKSQNADIYHLQEYQIRVSSNKYSQPDYGLDELKAKFKDYYIVEANEFITISKFPILKTELGNTEDYLKTIVDINDTEVALYNVHIPVHINLTLLPSTNFISDTHFRFNLREKSISDLESTLINETKPYIVSGDFNTTKNMRDIESIYKITNNNDSIYKSSYIFPGTWELKEMNLWRIDYMFGSRHIEFLEHKNINPQDFSDHYGLKVKFIIK